ncbi:MAG: small acid-soluble spore protein Tlp [Firmicutes bacterium HGW-Firmicutes-1]|jgi:small acid-soluble spore protein (thioredoxin-like protein)|nr:MAG: small acid-soluble spore protein Tlp [Firmicutes bacterium HGW-Firmicutes-1]
MKHNKDDRSDNVERIQYNIDMTLENIHRAEDMIDETDDEKTIETLKARNERREGALNGMREEIKDEAMDKKDGYK